jgi:VWFA-related protein
VVVVSGLIFSAKTNLIYMSSALYVFSIICPKHYMSKASSLSSKILLLLLVSCGCLCLQGAMAQSGRQPPPAATNNGTEGESTVEDGDLIRVRTEEVLVPVSVRDQVGLPVSGLSRDSFFVYDNGERQELTSFNRQRVPANIVLLLDASGSVFSRMRFIREAAKGFLQGLLPEDKVCVMQFADQVELLQDWTGGADTPALLKALEWRYHPGQATTFYDGLYLAAQEQLGRVEGRRIVILLTDGIDTSTRVRAGFADAMNALRRAEASVYVISLTESLRAAVEKRDRGWVGKVFGGYDPKALARYRSMIDEAEKKLLKISVETGGRMFLPGKDEDLSQAYSAIAEELRMQYILTYKPRKRASAGEYRRIRVLVSPGGYEVAARDGYVGRT